MQPEVGERKRTQNSSN
nr:unnamed protein product [Callosobruchus analis]